MKILTVLLLPTLFYASPAITAELAVTEDNVHALTSAGMALSATETEALEASLAQTPDDLITRVKLLGRYNGDRFHDDAVKQKRNGIILWIIRNKPESPVNALPYCELYPYIDGASVYAEARTLWLEKTGEGSTDTAIIWNAAAFLFQDDETACISLLRKGQALEPKNPRWPEKIAFRHLINATHARDKAQSYTKASLALKEYEAALKLTPLKYNQVLLYDELGILYFLIGRDDKATKYANGLIKDVPVDDWNYGNGVHDGQTILGLIAIKNGDIAKAREHLAESASIKGSPQLNSFGPHMDLAKALLEKGQKDAVLDYLEMCGKFWSMGKDQLAKWNDEIRKEVTPDFKMRLWISIRNPDK
jgi:tetratricopeptide (TPR) repeat protein